MRSNPAPDPRPTLAAPPNEESSGESTVFAQAGVALIGVEGTKIAAFNAAAEQLFYRTANAVRGMELSDLFASFHSQQVAECLRLASRGVPSFPSLLAARGYAAPTEVDVRVGPLSISGKIVGATLVVLDVRTQNRSMRELRAERDVARSAETAAVDALRATEVDDFESFPQIITGRTTPLDMAAGKFRGDRDTLIPGLLLEGALPKGAKGVLDLSEALFQRYDGQPRAMFRVVRKILERGCEAGSIRMKAQIQAARSDWSLLRVEIIESAEVHRDGHEWTLLRRRVTELEGGLGHEPHGCNERRIWMTFNLKSQVSRSSRPPHPFFHGLRVAVDVKSEDLYEALCVRLRAWKACPVRYAPTAQGDIVISDALPTSRRVVRLGADLSEPVVRAELRDVLIARIALARARSTAGHENLLQRPPVAAAKPRGSGPQRSSKPLKSSSAPDDDPSSYELPSS
ncbi:MAG: hypothetical protein ACI9KE_006255 [Polyangiales bacterium]